MNSEGNNTPNSPHNERERSNERERFVDERLLANRPPMSRRDNVRLVEYLSGRTNHALEIVSVDTTRLTGYGIFPGDIMIVDPTVDQLHDHSFILCISKAGQPRIREFVPATCTPLCIPHPKEIDPEAIGVIVRVIKRPHDLKFFRGPFGPRSAP